MNKNDLKQIVIDQSKTKLPQNYVNRKSYECIDSLSNNPHIVVIIGLRRAGKSTFMQTIRKQSDEKDYYLNFDDDRLVQFELADFQVLYDIFIELFGEQDRFYFDEIQNIPEWERFIRRLHDNGKKVFITGSNASMFSKELGTRLTGRHIEITFYPFSYYEYVQHMNSPLLDIQLLTSTDRANFKKLFSEYTTDGGIPEYFQNKNENYLPTIYQNIIYKDIIARHNVANEHQLKTLVFFLASNIGKNVSYNSLKKLVGLKSSTTVADYCSYLHDSFLCFFINRFDYSLKKQLTHSKKVYFIDLAIAHTVGFRFSNDHGRSLENIVFIELLRRKYTVFFHKETKECDFITFENNCISQAIQVTYSLQDEKTKKREYEGLIEAMQCYNLDEGYILTIDESASDTVIINGKSRKITVIPTWEWLLGISTEN